MPRNVELKAWLTDRSKACAIASGLSGAEPQDIHQHDIFFKSRTGRVKLRMFPDGSGELIQYDRPDTPSVRLSDYRIARTPDAQTLFDILTQTATVVGEVRKQRLVYLIGQTRVHIDCVDGLGDFVEFEVVLRPDQDLEDGIRIAEHLRQAFEIDRTRIVGGAYVDLIAATRVAPDRKGQPG
jgi:predicted adenylyl cyclase CyaB